MRFLPLLLALCLCKVLETSENSKEIPKYEIFNKIFK